MHVPDSRVLLCSSLWPHQMHWTVTVWAVAWPVIFRDVLWYAFKVSVRAPPYRHDAARASPLLCASYVYCALHRCPGGSSGAFSPCHAALEGGGSKNNSMEKTECLLGEQKRNTEKIIQLKIDYIQADNQLEGAFPRVMLQKVLKDSKRDDQPCLCFHIITLPNNKGSV